MKYVDGRTLPWRTDKGAMARILLQETQGLGVGQRMVVVRAGRGLGSPESSSAEVRGEMVSRKQEFVSFGPLGEVRKATGLVTGVGWGILGGFGESTLSRVLGTEG